MEPSLTTHDLKTWPQFFDAVESGEKTFELRKNDRGFAVRDFLRLMEWSPDTKRYTGRICIVQVTYMVTGAFGLEPGFSCLGIQRTHL